MLSIHDHSRTNILSMQLQILAFIKGYFHCMQIHVSNNDISPHLPHPHTNIYTFPEIAMSGVPDAPYLKKETFSCVAAYMQDRLFPHATDSF